MTGPIVPVEPGGRDELTAEARTIAAWVAALPALPADDGHRYSVRRLTAAWNLEAWGNSRHTAVAHRRDLSAYLSWCDAERLDPLTARPTDLAQFKVWRELQGGQSRHPAKPATVARALATVSSWYRHLVVNTDGVVANNPLAGMKRPKVPRNSTTAGLTLDEVDWLLGQADAEVAERTRSWRAAPGPHRQTRYLAALRDRALLRLLVDLGLRLDEALDRDIGDLSYQAGHRTLQFVGKGSDERERPLPADTARPLDEYLAARAELEQTTVDTLTGPLFATTGATGAAGRLAEPNVFTWLRRLAQTAGIASAQRLSPHSLRHAFATGARELDSPLEDVQDAMSHADPRTTRRYDRDRHNLDRDPAHRLSARRAPRRG